LLGRVGALHEPTERQVIALDGEAPRRPFDRARGKSALHLAHAWATADPLLLGQVAVDEKSSEITAIPERLEMLGISGAIVTIDAMGCQKEIARTIRCREAGAASWRRRPTTGGSSSRSRRPGAVPVPGG
jgi:hypothetical protein